MTKIKLCGISRECDVEVVNELMPDYVGFVFYEKSKRNVTKEKAIKLRTMLNPQIRAVGVFVNEQIDTILDLLNAGAINYVQLHGTEDEDYIKKLKSRTDAVIIKAFNLDDMSNVQRANDSSADYVLLDSGKGGTGNVFDWSLAEKVNRQFFLAGGLNPDNVAYGIRRIEPYAVDVSTGIETEGIKNPDKMRKFVRNVKGENI